MFRIFKNEWRILFREKTLWLAMLLLFVCVAYALFNGRIWHQKRVETVQTAVTEADSALTEQRNLLAEIEANGAGFKDSPAAGLPQRTSYEATLPPGPLSVFTIGQADLYPYQASISTWRRQDTLFRYYQIDSPISLSAGKFDFSFVVIYLLPLLIIALSYNLLSDEREKGTLAMVLSQPLILTKLIAGKVILRLALVTITMIVLGVIGWLFSMGSIGATGRLILWLTFALLYTWFWFALAAFINAFKKSSETNAAILTSFWLLLVLIFPALLNLSINWSSPVPSRFEYITAMRAAENDAQLKSNELLSQYYHDHPELVTDEKRSDFIAKYFTIQRDVEKVVLPVALDYETRLSRQQELISWFRFISPAIMLQEAFNDIAGSGIVRQQKFTQQVRENLTSWQGFLLPKVFRNERLSAADYNILPRFEFQEENFEGVVSRVAPALLGLIIPILLFSMWGSVKFREFHFS